MKIISIIVPIYNSESSLERCIKSILNQTYKNIEVILVNDGSKDKSLEICNKFKKIDNRIKIINIENSGVSAARNVGIDNAKGYFIQFVDSDDYIKETMCQKMINKIEEYHSELVICGYLRKQGNKYISNKIKNEECIELESLNWKFLNLYTNYFLNQTWNKLYKKEFIKFYFDENMSLAEDIKFNINYIENIKKITVIEDEEYIYDEGVEGSLTKKYRENILDIYEEIYDLILKFINNKKSNIDIKKINIFTMHQVINSLQVLVYEELRSKVIPKINMYVNHRLVKKIKNNLEFNDLESRLIYKFILKNDNNKIYIFYRIKKYIYNLKINIKSRLYKVKK